MGGRGTYAAGRDVPFNYKTVGQFNGIKVLEGKNGLHNLPEEAHSSMAYAKLYRDGNLQMLRFYDKDKYLVMEIGYHPVPELTGHRIPTYHVHEYKRDNFRDRSPRLLTSEEVERFGRYLTAKGRLK